MQAFAHSIKYGSYKSWGPVRMLCRSLFAAAPRQFERAWRRSFDIHRTAAAKQEQGASGTSPSFCNRHTRLNGRKPSSQHPNNPRKRREKAFQAEPEMPPPASFLLTPSKGAFSFRRNRKEKGGFAPRRSRKPAGFPGISPCPERGASPDFRDENFIPLRHPSATSSTIIMRKPVTKP